MPRHLVDALELGGANGHEIFAGRFRIEREAGVGGMGIVYRALDQTTGATVALKVLRKSGPLAAKRFGAEAEALDKLRHTAIIRYVAHGTGDEGQPFLAMEWVDGETLAARLRRGPLSVSEVITVGRRVADALASAHAVGVLHRDIKPSNVLLPHKDLGQAKIADFGLSRSIDVGQSTVTMTGMIVGTPGYMAPEQAHGVHDLDGRADLFSLGCLLFRCLTDTEAFEGSRALTALAKLVLLEPSRVADLRPDVPRALDDLVARLLEKERDQRPASAEVVREELGRIAALAPSEPKLRAAAPACPQLAPGAVFGRYVLGRRLGAGGMGELFSAHDTVLERRVALKVLRHATEGGATENLLREARAAAALSHPNVVTVYDVGEHDGIPFLAMEYIVGQTLRAYVGEPGADLDRRIAWMTDVARGLAAAHQAGLVHGDVKPENVMVGEDGAAKILDFGLATAVPDRIMGTAAYMAPEQIRGEVLDGRADQFAWAVTAYELITGRLPWPGDDALATLASVLSDEPEPIALPADLGPAISKALRKQRDERFPTMDPLVTVLGSSAHALGISTHPPPPPPRAPVVRKRAGPWIAWMAAALLAGIALAFGASSNKPAPASSQVPAVSSASSVPAAVVVTALPISPRCAPAAVTPLREGLAALREAGYRRALRLFERAAASDPSCPEAQLRLTMRDEPFRPREQTREQLRRAQALRDGLTERDQLVLDAWSALLEPKDPDEVGAERILVDASRKFPNDAELYTLAADRKRNIIMRPAELASVLGLIDRAIELDPKYADAWSYRSILLTSLDRPDEALAALDKCLEVAPGAVDCMEVRSGTLRRAGRCEDAAEAARAWISWEPSQPAAYQELAPSLASSGAPREAVEEALLLRWKNLPDADRDWTRLCDTAKLAVWSGDFDGALRTADELERLVTGSADVAPHLCAALASVDSLVESGRGAQAAMVAERFLRRNEAWLKGESNLGSEYPKTTLLGVAVEYGQLSPEGWREATDAWERSNGARMDTFERWLFRWGPAVGTRIQADEAMRRDPRLGEREPLPRARRRTFNIGALEAYEGRLQLLGGDASKAAPLLRTATQSCQALHHGALRVRANLWLGQAEEKRGDIPAACSAYRLVRERWGNAKPSSVTAREALRRSRALSCSP